MPADPLDRSTCRYSTGLSCPGHPCPGATDPGVCSHLKTLADWRKLTLDDQAGKLAIPRAPIDPAVRDAVNACPSRGPVLPLSMQDDCGCRGQELSECRQDRGAVPGRVTLRECLACRGAQPSSNHEK
jgi:hypothetical protein